MNNSKKVVVLHNSKTGNNSIVAERVANFFKCNRLVAQDNPSLNEYEFIIIILSNVGDEELPQPMEDFLCSLPLSIKKYFVCELGNYFGLEDYCGCKRVSFQILDNLGWSKLSDISLDSLPNIDFDKLDYWIEEIFHIIQNET